MANQSTSVRSRIARLITRVLKRDKGPQQHPQSDNQPAPAPIVGTKVSPSKPSAVSLNGPSHLTILVADHRQENRTTVTKMLDELGHRVIEAADGSQAIALAETQMPDILLLEMAMPGINGWEATRLLRQHSDTRLATIPVIALTSHLIDPSKTEQMYPGISELLTRPFDQSMLSNALNSAMVTNAFVASEMFENDEVEVLPLLNPAVLTQDFEEIGHDKTLNLIDQFLCDAPNLSQRIHKATKADQQCLAAASLKGAAGNVGLLRLEQVALEIEKGLDPINLERTVRESIRVLKKVRSQLSERRKDEN